MFIYIYIYIFSFKIILICGVNFRARREKNFGHAFVILGWVPSRALHRVLNWVFILFEMFFFYKNICCHARVTLVWVPCRAVLRVLNWVVIIFEIIVVIRILVCRENFREHHEKISVFFLKIFLICRVNFRASHEKKSCHAFVIFGGVPSRAVPRVLN